MTAILVFRALVLGDMVCATPALRALHAGLPDARITLVGHPSMRAWAERQDTIDDFVDCPGIAGLPEQPPADASALRAFIDAMHSRRYDLAVQLHGSGGIVNPFVASLGGRRNAGFWAPPLKPASDDFMRWPEHGGEIERLLALTDHLGLPRRGTRPDFPLRDADRAAAAILLPTTVRRYAVVHAGSQLPSRRWPPERFAAVADALAEAGLDVLLTGSAGEAPIAAAVGSAMRHAAVDLTGRTSVWTLGALVESAALVVCNDTGVSHIAAALGVPSVVIASGSDVARWAPEDRALHRVFHHDLPCRPCAHAVCPIGNACALAVPAAPVAAAALGHLEPALV